MYHGKKGSRKTHSSPGESVACIVAYTASVPEAVTRTLAPSALTALELPVAR